MRFRSFYHLLLAGLLLSSCNKEEGVLENPGNLPPISPVPASFKQNVLIEQFTQAGHGLCPASHLIVDSLVTFNPGRVWAASIHVGDPMVDSSITNLLTGANYLDTLFNPSSFYPSGMLNRTVTDFSDIFPTFWPANVNAALGAIPRCGLALEASDVTGNTLKLAVHVGFSDDLLGDYRLHVFLVQDAIQTSDTTYDQQNAFSQYGTSPDPASPYYLDTTYLRNYRHEYVLKRIATDAGLAGDIIPQNLMSSGNEFVRTYTINLTGINRSNTRVIAFVDKYGTSGTTHRIENVKACYIGEAVDWN